MRATRRLAFRVVVAKGAAARQPQSQPLSIMSAILAFSAKQAPLATMSRAYPVVYLDSSSCRTRTSKAGNDILHVDRFGERGNRMLAATERFVRVSLILGICILLVTHSIARANKLDYIVFQAQLAPIDIEAIEAKFQMTKRRPPLSESQVERIIPTLLPSLTGKTDVALLDRKDWEKINHKLEEIDREQQHSQDFISVARSGAGLRFSYYRDFNSVQDPYITFIAPSSDAKSHEDVFYRIDHDGRNAIISRGSVGLPELQSDFYRLPKANRALFEISMADVDGRPSASRIADVVNTGSIGALSYLIEPGSPIEGMDTIIMTLSAPGVPEQDFHYYMLVLKDYPDVLVELITKASGQRTIIRNSEFSFNAELGKPIPYACEKSTYQGTELIEEKSVKLYEISINQPIPDAMFTFEPPPNYTIIDGRAIPPLVTEPDDRSKSREDHQVSPDGSGAANYTSPASVTSLASVPSSWSSPAWRTECSAKVVVKNGLCFRFNFFVFLCALPILSFLFAAFCAKTGRCKWLFNRKVQLTNAVMQTIILLYLLYYFFLCRNE